MSILLLKYIIKYLIIVIELFFNKWKNIFSYNISKYIYLTWYEAFVFPHIFFENFNLKIMYVDTDFEKNENRLILFHNFFNIYDFSNA